MYSVRMRATEAKPDGRHISGAERLVAAGEVVNSAGDMLRRALNHSRGVAGFIQITVEAVAVGQVGTVPLLPVRSVDVNGKGEGLAAAGAALAVAGVSRAAVLAGVAALTSLSDSMRGAMVICAATGEKLITGQRGIRVSRLDAADKNALLDSIKKRGLTATHLPEALVLASKVVAAPGVVAELCWSDDPEYTAGYVASAACYVRFAHLKDYGDPVGGRVFFVEVGCDLELLRHYLEEQAVLVEGSVAFA